MMTNLVVNCGSSSLKVSLYDSPLELIALAHLKSIHSEEVTFESMGEKKIVTGPLSIKESIKLICSEINCKNVSIVGHRIVHGGNYYTSPTLIDKTVLSNLKKISHLAPLHNPICIEGIEATKEFFPKAQQIAVFDTAFHHTLPEEASTYGIPTELAKKYEIKRYGFHGIAHAYLWERYASISSGKDRKIITIHLGNGCSMTAIHEGISIDTSMGFTPLEGLLMSTRSGDIDPAIVEYLCLHEKQFPTEILQLLNTASGLLGISELSDDMKTLEKHYSNPKVKLAIDVFCYRIVKYIGAYWAILGGCNAIIFSGGIGENSSFIRQKIVERLKWMEAYLDTVPISEELGTEIQINSKDSKVDIFVIRVDENRYIAKQCIFKLFEYSSTHKAS